MRRWIASIAVVSFLSLAAAVAGSAPVPPGDRLLKASELANAGKLDEAARELKTAVQEEPRNSAAHRALGDVYLKLKDGQAALQEYQEAVSLDPKDLEARIKVAGLYLAGRRFEDAAAHAEKAIEFAPARYEPYAILAQAKAGLRDWPEATAAMEKAVRAAPENEVLWLGLANLHAAQKDPAAAEEALRRGLAAVPPSRAIRIALVGVLASKRRFSEADALVDEVLNLSPDDPRATRYAAQYRLKRGDRGAAEALLKKSIELAGDNTAERVQALGDLSNLYASQGNLADARKALEEIPKLAPEDPVTTARLANLDLLADEPDRAEPLIRKLLERDAKDPNARLLQARLELARGRAAEARIELEALAKDAPDSVNTQLFLGKAYATERRWEEAEKAYGKVLAEVPDHYFANLDMAKIAFLKGRPAEALEPLDRALKLRPADPELRRLRADALLAAGKSAEAEAEYRGLLQQRPGEALFEMRLGQALEAQGRNEEALEHYTASRKAAKGTPEPVLREMALLGRLKRQEAADEAGRDFLAANGEVPAVLNALVGNSLVRRDPVAARAYLDRSLHSDPASPDTRELEARYLFAQGDEAGGRKALEAALASDPDRLSALLLLASLHDRGGRQGEAKEVYEKILTIDPDNVLAANNLAVILSGDESKLPEALRLARVAAQRAPGSGFTLDTLGWVQYRAGQFEQALKNLEEARRLLPSNPEVQFHAGMAHARVGEREKAKELLRDALSAAPGSAWAPEAKRAMEALDPSAK